MSAAHDGDQPLVVAQVVFRPDAMFDVLARHGVAFVVIGGVAGNLLGSPSLTSDLDLTPRDDEENLTRLADALRELGAQFRVPGSDAGVPVAIDAYWLRNLVSATFITSAGPLDVVRRPDGVGGFEELAANAITVEVDGVRILVAAIDDVIASKEAANRPKDVAMLPALHELRRRLREGR